jgi:NADH-quinone oxidoreductase subunit N
MMGSELTNAALLDIFQYLIPEMILVGAACAIFVGGTWRAGRSLWATASLVALAAAGSALCATDMPKLSGDAATAATFFAPIAYDSLAMFIRWIALGAGIVLVLFSWNEVPERHAAEFHACLLIIIAGVSLTGAANDLVTLFLALEMISIPTYILLYIPKHDDAAQEAALKYFLLSVFASALTLFGFSYLFGLGGTTNIPSLLDALRGTEAKELPGLAAVALILVVAGLGFRVTAAPFHFYAPDVYQGAPTVGAALLAVIPKLAGFAALLRVLGFVLPEAVLPRGADATSGGYIGLFLSDQVPILFWFLAAVTMFLGNLLALLQDNVKRLLAYSSVAHAGYMLIALAAAPYLRHDPNAADGVEALLYYLVSYGVMTIGAFAVIAYLSSSERPVEAVDDLAGLGRTHPHVALLMTLFMFSLIGIPLTAGFTGKFLVFFGAMGVPQADYAVLFRILALLGVLNAAIAGWYYLRIVAVMYLRTAIKPLAPANNWPGLATLCVCGLLTIGLAIPPGADWLLDAARKAAGPKPPTATRADAARPQ